MSIVNGGVQIDPSIGSVASSGQISISPTVTQTYTITALGPGGHTEKQATVTVLSPISLKIQSPKEGQVLNAPTTVVRGTFSHSQGLETGITVNGNIAQIAGNQFAAPAVALQPGQNVITVQAIDSAGHTAEVQATITADLSGQAIVLNATPALGIAPFEAELTVENPFESGNVTLTYEGAGDVTWLDTSVDTYRIQISEPGLYLFTAHGHDAAGNEHLAETAVTVLDRQTLDTLLKGKWNSMKQHLASGDIEGALEYHSLATQDIYREIFTALADRLPGIARNMQDIELIQAEDGFAKYRIKRNEVFQGQDYAISYYIYFDCDEEGIWKIYRY